MINTNTYVVVDISELNNIDYSQVLQTSSDTVRKNIEQSKFILKYDGPKPSIIQLLEVGDKLYTYFGKKFFNHPQILSIISSVEWVGTQSFI